MANTGYWQSFERRPHALGARPLTRMHRTTQACFMYQVKSRGKIDRCMHALVAPHTKANHKGMGTCFDLSGYSQRSRRAEMPHASDDQPTDDTVTTLRILYALHDSLKMRQIVHACCGRVIR